MKTHSEDTGIAVLLFKSFLKKCNKVFYLNSYYIFSHKPRAVAALITVALGAIELPSLLESKTNLNLTPPPPFQITRLSTWKKCYNFSCIKFHY